MTFKIVISIALSFLVVGCAVNSKKLQNQINERISDVNKTNLSNKAKISNLDIELKINKDISFTTNCEQSKSSFVPALFYWGWNSEVLCELSREEIERQLAKEIIFRIEENNLQNYFKDKKLLFTIDELPTKFKFQDKGNVVYLILAYAMSQKRYFAPELIDFKGSYKILDEENHVVLENSFVKALTLKAQTSNSKSTKKLSWQYLDSYNVEINRFVKIVFNEMKERIQE